MVVEQKSKKKSQSCLKYYIWISEQMCSVVWRAAIQEYCNPDMLKSIAVVATEHGL